MVVVHVRVKLGCSRGWRESVRPHVDGIPLFLYFTATLILVLIPLLMYST